MHRNGLLDVCPPQGHALKVTSGKFITLTLSPHTMESQNTIIVRMFSLSIQHPVLFHWIDGKNSTRLDDHCHQHIILHLVDNTVHVAFNLRLRTYRASSNNFIIHAAPAELDPLLQKPFTPPTRCVANATYIKSSAQHIGFYTLVNSLLVFLTLSNGEHQTWQVEETPATLYSSLQSPLKIRHWQLCPQFHRCV